MFWGTGSSEKCFLILGGAAPYGLGSLCLWPRHLGRPLAEASAGQPAGGPPDTLGPAITGAGPSLGFFLCLLSSGFCWSR